MGQHSLLTFQIKLKLIAFFILAFLTNETSFAVGSSGIANPSLNARIGAMANAGISLADDPATVWFNPAGMVDAGDSFSFGTTYITSKINYSGENGESANKNDSFASTYNLYAIKNLNQKMGVGIGINSPFGLKTEWDESGPFSTVATNSSLKMVDINPSIAYKPTHSFSLGAGIDYFYVSEVSIEKKSIPTGNSKLAGDGDGWGYNFGFLYSVLNRHSFGATYRSRVVTKIEGSTKLTGLTGPLSGIFGTNYESPVNTELEFPPSFSMGYTFHEANDKFLLSFAYEWAGWSTFDETNLKFKETNPTQRSILDSSSPIPRHWRDTNNFSIGSEFKISKLMAIQGGYFFFDQVVPNDTFNPSIPVNKRHGFTIGTTLTKTPISIQVGYKAIFIAERTVKNNIGAATGQNVNGTYKGFGQTFGVNIISEF